MKKLFLLSFALLSFVPVVMGKRLAPKHSLDADKKGAALMAAIKTGDVGEANKLLADTDTRINARDSDGMTVLMVAAREGQPGMVKALLTNYFKDDIFTEEQDNKGMTALMHAVVRKPHNIDVVKLLVNDPCTNLDVQAGKGAYQDCTAYDIALKEHNFEAAQVIKAGTESLKRQKERNEVLSIEGDVRGSLCRKANRAATEVNA